MRFIKTKRLTTAVSALMVLALSVVLLGGCSSPAKESAPTPDPAATTTKLQIFAANSLEKALPEVQALYTAANPNVTFADTQFKGSGDLVTELKGGASADLLITASGSTMDQAVADQTVQANTRLNMFGNDLVIVAPTDSKTAITALKDVQKAEFKKIAIGDADAVPAGAYANQALSTIKLYSDASGKGGKYLDDFDKKVVAQSSVGNVAKVVSTGDCQIGFVYTSDLYRYDGIKTVFTVPAADHKAIVYPGAVCANSNNAELAQGFLDFCLANPEALKIWAKYGFEVV